MKSTFVFGAIGLGLLLLGLSGLWPRMFPGTSMWTIEKAERWAEVKDRLHNLSFIINRPASRMHSGPDPGPVMEEYKRLKKEGEQLKVDFEAAALRPQTISKILKWTGISCAVIGVIGAYAVKNTS